MATTIPYFIPQIGINFSILYGILYIIDNSKYLVNLNFWIAVGGCVSSTLSLLFLRLNWKMF